MKKQAQIPSTLTWFVAFLIIFFMIILFISASIIIGLGKEVTFRYDVIGLKIHDQNNLKTQRILFEFLNSGVKNENYKDLIIKWAEEDKDRDKIKADFENILKNDLDKEDCYAFQISDSEKGIKSKSFSDDYDLLLINAVKLYLISENHKIKIEVISGKC